MPNASGRGAGSGGGGSKGGGKGKGKGGGGGSSLSTAVQWDCRTCGCTGNWDTRTRCRECHALRRREGGGVTPAPAASSTLAERQLQRQREDQLLQKKRLQEENKRLRAENQRIESENEAARAANRRGKTTGVTVEVGGDEESDCDMDVTEGYAAMSTEERQRKLDLAKSGLAYAVDRDGEESPEAEKIRGEIADIQRAMREAKPFRAHRAQLERRRDRLRKQQERDEAETVKLQTEIEELRAKKDELQNAISERGKTIGQVERELTDLVKRSLAEEGDGGDGGAAWSAAAASTIISNLANKPGVPPEFAALLEQVRMAAMAIAASAAAAATTTTTTTPTTPTPQTAHGPAPPTPPLQQSSPPAQASTADGKGKGQGGGKGEGLGTNSATTPTTFDRDGRPTGREDPAPIATPPVDDKGPAGLGEGDKPGSDDELVDDAAMEDVEASIRRLPKREQRWVRAAIRSRAEGPGCRRGGGDETEEGGATSPRPRSRDRSPRRKAAGGDEDEQL